MTDEPDFEIGTFNPVEAFEQTLFDLVQIIETFEADETGAMDPMAFLQASRVASDRMRAITTMTMAGLLQAVAHKIPEDVRDTFQQQMELDELMLSPEEKHKKMIKALKDITTWSKRQR